MKILFGEGIKETDRAKIEELLVEFYDECLPIEEILNVFLDKATGAIFCECHIKGGTLIEKCTIDVPLDPEEQSEYRANRKLVEDNVAFAQMKVDALNGRIFSNIVAEYGREFDEEHPIKIIGGQHRVEAIRDAFSKGINEYQGIKLYFELTVDQRLDVQLISNTNIDVSPDLLDRMMETYAGPDLRNWCQKAELLEMGCDFADKKSKTDTITVREARTFIINYYLGKKVEDFASERTDGIIAQSGGASEQWDELKRENPNWNTDEQLLCAGKEYSKLMEKQKIYFATSKSKSAKAYSNKAHNYAILAAWAFVAGLLSENEVRLNRHYNLPDNSTKDPLNAAALASARHKSDPENYRGLGTRTDAKERGRLIELFNLQAEKGEGINSKLTKLAMSKYHAKKANLEVLEIEEEM